MRRARGVRSRARSSLGKVRRTSLPAAALSRAGAPSRSSRSAQPGRPPSLASAAAFPDDEPRLAGGMGDEDEEEDEEGEPGGDKEMLGRLIVGELAARPDEGKRPGNLSLPFCSIISWRVKA